jgi:hypothetical protein
MGHITPKSFKLLQKRLNKSPQGLPESETAYKILEHLFSEKEAKLVSILPIRPFNIKEATKIWKISEQESKNNLDALADRGIIIDLAKPNQERVYAIAPPMAGFIEFSIMKTHGKVNKQLLSELYYQYLNQEDKFTEQVFSLYPSIARTYVQEDTIPEEHKGILRIAIFVQRAFVTADTRWNT